MDFIAHSALKLTTMREVLSAIGESRDILQGQFVNNVVAATDAFFFDWLGLSSLGKFLSKRLKTFTSIPILFNRRYEGPSNTYFLDELTKAYEVGTI